MMKASPIFLAVVVAISSPVTNSSELRPSVGINCGISAGDGAWKQDGQAYTYENCRSSGSLQFIGDLPFRVGPFNFDYAVGAAYRRGAKVSDGEWVSDKCYERHQYSGGEIVNYYGTPQAECDLRWYSSKVEQHTQAGVLAIGVILDTTADLSFRGAIGISFYKTITKVEWDKTRGVCMVSECAPATYYRSGQSVYFELGTKYRNVSLTTYYAPDERGREAISKGNYGVMIGYGFKL